MLWCLLNIANSQSSHVFIDHIDLYILFSKL